MSRAVLSHIASAMAHMVVSRMSKEDYEALSQIPDGTLTIDLLRLSAHHTEAGAISLDAAAKLAAWLKDRLATTRLALSDLTKAELQIVIRTDRAPADRGRLIPFDFSSTGAFATRYKPSVSKPARALRWYTRGVGVTE
jgi:hypothetical protein